MATRAELRPIEILLVEDNPGDIRLTIEALKEGKVRNNLNVAKDGVEALCFLRRESPFEAAPRPDLILLDLNLPKKDGRELLALLEVVGQYKAIVVLDSAGTQRFAIMDRRAGPAVTRGAVGTVLTEAAREALASAHGRPV